MALQSSGQIKISEIKAELGSSSNSLATLSTAAGKSAPHAMSEFYGYSAAKYYWDLSNDIKWDTATDKPLQSTSESLSVSLWIRPQWSAQSSNLIIFDLTPSGTTSTANRFFLQYNYNQNRFVINHRSNSTNFRKDINLHSNNDATGTGTSSSDKWLSTNRGNTNSDGFVHLFLIYDASASGPDAAFKLYWNGTALSTTASTSNGTRSNMTLDELTFCGNDHNTAGSRIADYSHMHMWDDVWEGEDVSTMYNSGDFISASAASRTTDLIFGDTSETVPNVNDPDDSSNYEFANANNQSVVQI